MKGAPYFDAATFHAQEPPTRWMTSPVPTAAHQPPDTHDTPDSPSCWKKKSPDGGVGIA